MTVIRKILHLDCHLITILDKRNCCVWGDFINNEYLKFY